ncbi:MAG: response regulator [Armatimonadetes bacterium]|nr:response regulator [Armatimonadota bacterium]
MGQAELQRPVILIVDDDEHRRELHHQLMELAGYEPISAASAPEALEIVSQQTVHLVLLDIAMPGMDGIEALGRLLDLNRQMPVIIYTAYSSYRDDFQTWAAEAYVTKETSQAELLRAIREALEKRGIEVPEAARKLEQEETLGEGESV